MKKHLLLYLSCLALTATHSFAQTPDNPLFRNIPPDATTVYQINLPVITTQISWQELMETMPPSNLVSGDPSAATLLRDPALAGIDIGKDIFIAVKNPGFDSAGYTTVIVHLLDSAKFRAALRKEEAGLRVYSIPNKNKIRLAGKGKLGAAWSKGLAVLVLVKAPLKEGRESKTTPPDYASGAAKRGLAAIQGFDGSFYTTDPVFQAGFSDGAAVNIWAEQGQAFSMLGKNPLMAKSPIARYFQTGAKILKSNTLTAIRLEPGRITMSSNTVATPVLKALYAKLNSRPLNMDLQSRIPPGNLLALINLRFDPLMFKDILPQGGGLHHKIDSFMTAKGLPLDTLLHAFSGDFQVVCMEPHLSAENGKPKFPLYFVTTIGDPAAFYKLATTVKAISDSAGTDSATGKRRSPLANLKSSSTLQDNILVISGSKEQSNGWFSNTEKRNTDFLTDRMKDNPFSILIDFKTLTHFVESMSKGKEPAGKDKKILSILHGIDQLEITGGAMRNDKVESFFELKLTDSSPNSIRNFIKGLR